MDGNQPKKQELFTSLDALENSHANSRSKKSSFFGSVKSKVEAFVKKNALFQKLPAEQEKATDSPDNEKFLIDALKKVEHLEKNAKKSQQGISELDPVWHIWRYEVVTNGKPVNIFITYTDESKTEIADIRFDDGQQDQKGLVEEMRIAQSLNGKIEKAVAQEDAAMRFLGDVLGYTLDKDGKIQKIVAFDNSAPSSWEAKDKLDFEQAYNNYFPLRDRNNPKWVPLPLRDSKYPTKVDVRTRVGEIIIVPGHLNKMLDLYAKAKGKDDRFGLTKQARDKFENDIKNSIREHLEAIINRQTAPSTNTINFIESLEKKHLRLPNDMGLIGQRGNELQAGLAKEEVPNILNRVIMGFLNGIPYVGRKEIRAGEARYPNMDSHTFQTTFKGKEYVMNGSAIPSTLAFTNTAYDISNKEVDQKRTNCYLAAAMVEFIDATGKTHAPRMLPFFYGGRNLKGTLWVEAGSAHLKDIEHKIFSSGSEDTSEVPQPISSPSLQNWTEIQKTLKESVHDNAGLIGRFVVWAQEKQETPPQTAEEFATLLNTFFTTECSPQKTQEHLDIIEDDLNRMGEAIFPEYEFDIDRPGGFAQLPLSNDEQDQSDAFKNEIKRNWFIDHNEKSDLGFLNSSFDAVFRTLKDYFNTSIPYTHLETQKKASLSPEGMPHEEGELQLQIQTEMRERQYQEQIEAQFNEIKNKHKTGDGFQKGSQHEQERELLVIDCLNDIYKWGIISKETVKKIQNAQRLEDDTKEEIVTQFVGQITHEATVAPTTPQRRLPIRNKVSFANHWKKELFSRHTLNPSVNVSENTLTEHLHSKGVQELSIDTDIHRFMFLGCHDHTGLGYFGIKKTDGTDQLVYLKAQQMNKLNLQNASWGDEISYEKLAGIYENSPDISASRSEETNIWKRKPENKDEVKSVVDAFDLFNAERVNPDHKLSELLVLKKDNDRIYFASYLREDEPPKIIYANHNDPDDIEKMRLHSSRKWRHSISSAFEVGQEVDIDIKSELDHEEKIEREIEVKTKHEEIRRSKRRKI